MEGLAALGLIGNVVQFVQFLSELISTGSDLYRSMDGAAASNIELEQIYGKLSSFSSSLIEPSNAQTDPHAFTYFAQTRQDLTHVKELNSLGKDCKALCDQLLDTVSGLRVEGVRWRHLKSFRGALKTVWESKKISNFESRIERFQRIIILHFFPILRYVDSGHLSDSCSILIDLGPVTNNPT
jgi:hypothetical protein